MTQYIHDLQILSAALRRYNMVDKEFDTSFNPDFAVCPYCGYEEQDSWGLSDGEHDCSDCGKTFLVTIDTTVYYTTTKIEEDTQEEEEVSDD